MLKEIKRLGVLLNPKSLDIDKLAARNRLESSKELPFETRWKLAEPLFHSFIERNGEPYSAGHDTLNGWFGIQTKFGPDVLAHAIEEELVDHPKDSVSDVILDLQKRAILKGWKTNLRLHIPTENIDTEENPTLLLLAYDKYPLILDVAKQTGVDIDIVAEQGENGEYFDGEILQDIIPDGKMLVRLTSLRTGSLQGYWKAYRSIATALELASNS